METLNLFLARLYFPYGRTGSNPDLFSDAGNNDGGSATPPTYSPGAEGPLNGSYDGVDLRRAVHWLPKQTLRYLHQGLPMCQVGQVRRCETSQLHGENSLSPGFFSRSPRLAAILRHVVAFYNP